MSTPAARAIGMGIFFVFIWSSALAQGDFTIDADLRAIGVAGSPTPKTSSILFTNSSNGSVHVTLIESDASCSASFPLMWLTESQSSFTVLPMNSYTVSVSFDSSLLFAGQHQGQLCAVTTASIGNETLPVNFEVVNPLPLPLVVYDDTAQNGFEAGSCTFYGQGAFVNFDTSSRVHSGAASVSAGGPGLISVKWCASNGGIYVPYTTSVVNFWVYLSEKNGGLWTLRLNGFLPDGNETVESATLNALYGSEVPDHQWININAPLQSSLFTPLLGGNFTGASLADIAFEIQNNDGIGVIYLDDIAFIGESIFQNGLEN